MKYNIIYKNNFPNPSNRWIDEDLSNHKRTNPLVAKYTASNDAQATPFMDLWMMESIENDDGTISWP